MSERELSINKLEWEVKEGRYYAFALGLGYTVGRANGKYIAYKSERYAENPIISQTFPTMKEATEWCQIDFDMGIKSMISFNSKKRYTGWYVLVSQEENGQWTSVACINPDDEKWCDKEIPSGDVIMPIPDPETISEFEGF